jgi:hypothetical protein
MFIHHAHRLAALLVLATLTSYGCENDNGPDSERPGSIRPSPISFNGLGQPAINNTDFFSRGVTLQPAVVIPQLVPEAACPVRPPFLAPFRLKVTNEDQEDVFLSKVQMNFVGRTGRFGETLTLSGSQLVDRFGSIHIPRFGSRLFPLTLPFGCTGDRVGTLSVGVFTADSRGRMRQESLTVEVR